MKSVVAGLVICAATLGVRVDSQKKEIPPKKETRILHVLETLSAIQKRIERPGPADDAAIGASVSKILDSRRRSAEELRQIAVLSYFLAAPRNAGLDQRSDDFFEKTFWSCVKRLGEIDSKESKEALRMLETDVHPSGGDRVLFDYLAYGKKY